MNVVVCYWERGRGVVWLNWTRTVSGGYGLRNVCEKFGLFKVRW